MTIENDVLASKRQKHIKKTNSCKILKNDKKFIRVEECERQLKKKKKRKERTHPTHTHKNKQKKLITLKRQHILRATITQTTIYQVETTCRINCNLSKKSAYSTNHNNSSIVQILKFDLKVDSNF